MGYGHKMANKLSFKLVGKLTWDARTQMYYMINRHSGIVCLDQTLADLEGKNLNISISVED